MSTENEIRIIKQGVRTWDAQDEFEYRGSHVVLKQWVHKDERLVVTQAHINEICYPFLHRSKQGAQEAAMRIIDKQEGPK